MGDHKDGQQDLEQTTEETSVIGEIVDANRDTMKDANGGTVTDIQQPSQGQPPTERTFIQSGQQTRITQ